MLIDFIREITIAMQISLVCGQMQMNANTYCNYIDVYLTGDVKVNRNGTGTLSHSPA